MVPQSTHINTAFAIQIIAINDIEAELKVSFGVRDRFGPVVISSDGNIFLRSPVFSTKSFYFKA